MKTNNHLLTLALFAGLAAGLTNIRAAEKNKDAEAKPYPAAICLISEEKLGSMGKPFALVSEGQEIKFCCKGCLKDFEKDKAGFMKKLSKAEASAKAYPLKGCVVTGEAFDHGQPYVFAYEGQQMKLCCKDCLADFKKEPVKFLKKVTDNAKK